MLTADCNGTRVDAATSVKGLAYACPSCRHPVTLRQGAIKIAHFAHKPPTDCNWAKGETKSHRQAKVVLREAYRSLGYSADFEVEVLSVGGDRRADVLITSPDGRQQWAVEVQHTPILYPAIEMRTVAYIAAGIPVLWMGILTEKMRAEAEPTASGMVLRQYTIRPWEKWAQALAFKELWYIDPEEETLWLGRFSDHMLYVEATSWFESGGVEQSAGGYSRPSKKWRTLTLQGPFYVDKLSLGTKWRKAWSSPRLLFAARSHCLFNNRLTRL